MWGQISILHAAIAGESEGLPNCSSNEVGALEIRDLTPSEARPPSDNRRHGAHRTTTVGTPRGKRVEAKIEI